MYSTVNIMYWEKKTNELSQAYQLFLTLTFTKFSQVLLTATAILIEESKVIVQSNYSGKMMSATCNVIEFKRMTACLVRDGNQS